MRILSPEQADSVSPEPILRFSAPSWDKSAGHAARDAKRSLSFDTYKSGDILPDGEMRNFATGCY